MIILQVMRLSAVAVCLSLFQAVAAHAAVVAVPNFSFENPTLAPGQFTQTSGLGDSTAIPGWTVSGTVPVIAGIRRNSDPTTQFSSLPDGNQFAYVGTRVTGNQGNMVLTAPTGNLPTIVAGTGYTVTVAVGRNIHNTFGAGSLELDLTANGTVVASTFLDVNTVTGDTFKDISTTLSPAASAAFAGQQLSIRLVETNTSPAGSGDYNEVALDNVRLVTTAVPEPASLGVLALGAAALLTKRRRRVG